MKRKKIIITLLLLGNIMGVWGAKTKKTPNPEEILAQGREAFLNYKFDEASDLYDQYRSLKSKAKQPVSEELEVWEVELGIAANAFEKVQKIVIVDSITVPAETFYNTFNLSGSAGKIGPGSSLSNLNSTDEIGFLSETGDFLFIPSENKDGDLMIIENRRLLDGNWESEGALKGDFEKSGDYAYPFMSGDGQTFYFANNGEGSMGGWDIFVAQKDPFTGEYLQPLNLGMPFNSPYNDYMMVIDEENGLGWWATDRNSFEGKVTIYVYLLDEIRRNYPEDTDNLPDYAKITDYKATWEEADKESIRKALEKINK